MTTLRFATGNAGKVREAAVALAPLGITVEQAAVPVVEIQADTLAEVARAKLADAARKVAPPFFLDDAGLFVDALRGFPGVYSAHALKTIGVDGLLRLLEGRDDRGARFEAVVAYQPARGEPFFAHGVARGAIARKPADAGHGFGFDPVFVPEDETRTYAELPTDVKNRVSHRGRALAQLVARLREEGFGR